MVPATTNKMISSSQRPYASIYPQQYIAYRSPSSSSSSGGGPPIIIDGNLDKPFWNEVNWSDDFVDIATDTKPKFRTRIKMRWDDDFLYVGAYMVRYVVLLACSLPIIFFFAVVKEMLTLSYRIVSFLLTGRERCLGNPKAT